MVFQKLSRL